MTLIALQEMADEAATAVTGLAKRDALRAFAKA